jgi:DNA polymerase/3'-5' exonuclease PolX
MDHKENIINALTIMKNNAISEGATFQARAYDKVIKNLKEIKEPILNYKQIENIDGAGKKIKLKFQEIISTGKLKEAEKIIEREDTDIKSQLLNVYGIGPSKAKSLIEKFDIKSIDDLRKKSKKNPDMLTSAQHIGLKCYEDLLERIPREEMLQHKKILDIRKNKGTIVGSFRRKEKTSGDIDVMLNMNKIEFNTFINNLDSNGYIKYYLAKGDKKILAICKLKDGKYRRIDLIRNNQEEYPFMKLYFTGSAKFNVAFRQHCLKLGLSLNEHSFTPKVDGLKTEEDIFKYVELEYVKPENRIDSSSLIYIKK